MGNLLFGGVRPSNILYNGKEVQTVKLDGVVVWQRYVPLAEGSIKVSDGEKLTVPARVKVLATDTRKYYIKVTEGKAYTYQNKEYYLHIAGGGSAEQYGGNLEKLGDYLIQDTRRGGSISRVVSGSTTFFYSEEINKHATNGSAD